jgi:3-methyl-2-oxobutanoate hydroxymethyltransferase
VSAIFFQQKKQNQEKIVMVTCYDYTTATIFKDAAIDALLVGDSLAMTMHGFKDTLMATLTMMELHTAAVSRGAGTKFIISDLPFLSYRKSLSKSVSAAEKLVRAGAHALKLENAIGNCKLIAHLVASGIPIMGHLGLTPQFIRLLGGYKIQGKTAQSAQALKQAALELQEAGCFALVLECIPAQLAQEITQTLIIPTIGIGAGVDTDGQILVMQDLLGLNLDFKPKFVKAFLPGGQLFRASIDEFAQSVIKAEFPQHGHHY